jgi:hypothetical protein
MRKIAIAMVLAALSGGAMAQKKQEDVLASRRYFNQEDVRRTELPTTGHNRGGQIVFQDDFANGFAGNNGFGAWLPWDTSADTSIWMLAAATSPNGQYTGNLAGMSNTGTTAANGWIILDADLYNTSTVSGGDDVSAWLQSPAFDCSQLSSVIVNYNQYFIYCCFSASPLTLEVSTDNGATWVAFAGHGDFAPAANSLSANPLPTGVDISCVAAGQPNVMIRFGYNTAGTTGYSHYFWGIDDVVVAGNPVVNDLEIRQVVNGDVWNLWEFRLTPMEQKVLSADGGLLVGTFYRNSGSADQTNASLNIEITDAAGTIVHTQTESLGTVNSLANATECPAFLNDTLYVSTGWEPTTVGVYTITVTISADSTDATPDNNTMTRVIEYSVDEYGHDDSNLDIQLLANEAPSDPTLFAPHGYGNFYHFPYDGSSVYGSSFLLGDQSDLGAFFNTILYFASSGMNSTSPAPEVVASNEVELTQAMISTGADAFYYVPFTESAQVLPNEVYFHCLLTNADATTSPTTTTDLQMAVLAQDNSDTDNSTAELLRTGSNTYAWFTSRSYSPAIRLIVGERVSVDEINDGKLGTFKLFPNPAVTHAQIQYTMTSPAAIAYEIRDVQGKLVTYANVGIKPEGQHSIDIPLDKLNNGHYQVSLVVAGKKLYSKSLQVNK